MSGRRFLLAFGSSPVRSFDFPPLSSRERLFAWSGIGMAVLFFGLGLWLRHQVNVWAIIFGSAAAALLICLPALRRHTPLDHQNMGASVWKGLLGGVLMVFATRFVFLAWITLAPETVHDVRELYSSLNAFPGPFYALPILLLVVFSEEVLFRGLLVHLLADRFRHSSDNRVLPILLVSVLLYALPQIISGSWVLVLLSISCGLVWTLQRLWSGNIWMSTFTHLVWSVMLFVFWPLPV